MLNITDYQLEFRRFLSSQHLYTGIRVTAGVLIPAIVLYQFGLLSSMISIPLGALFTGLTDNPGTLKHRRNGMLISIGIMFVIVLVTGFSRFSHALISAEIIIFGIFFSLISIYGSRAASIGLIALIVFILNVDTRFGSTDIVIKGFYYVTGGLWYAFLSLSLYTLRPYRPVQQLLGENLMKTSEYLRNRGRFYDTQSLNNNLFIELIDDQVRIHQYQEQLREMLFTTRRFISESTHKGRILMMIFRDSIDLFERIMTAQQDYALLHKEFDGTPILGILHKNINTLADLLHSTGLAIQEGNAELDDSSADQALEQSMKAFKELREQKLYAGNIEGFIKLRHILNSLQDLTGRIRRIQKFTSYDRSLAGQYKQDVDLSKFATHEEINVDLFRANISLKSANFRHALRLTIALLAGYAVSLFFAVGHGYWILLTIATIIKPAYSLSKQRNLQRLLGTFAGAGTGFLVIYVSSSSTVIFLVMVVMMLTAYSLLKINYGVSIASLTVVILLSFHFLDPVGMNHVLQDRIIDTVAGSAIAYLVSYFVLPAWEHQQIDGLMIASVEANRVYFVTVSEFFTGRSPETGAYKLARKQAFVTLANLSDNFQRMLSDPKNQQPNLPLYQQFVSGNHMLTSHIAALSSYAQEYGAAYAHPDFQPLITLIDKTFLRALATGEMENISQSVELNDTPIFKRVQRLMEQRKKDLEKGLETTAPEARKMVSELTAITDQFRLIYGITGDLLKLFGEIKRKDKQAVN